MKIMTTYSIKIKHYNHIFKETVAVYRQAVDFLIKVCNEQWDVLSELNAYSQLRVMEMLIHKTKYNPNPIYNNFDTLFYKFPNYLRRSAITKAIGLVSSYRSNLANWETKQEGKAPTLPKAGYIYPVLYRVDTYKRTDTYIVQIKVYIRNTWDWIAVNLRKTDVDYIANHCYNRKECSPTLQKRGKEWFLDFPFEEKVTLCDVDIREQTIVAVDLGINCAATVTAMKADGTILGRHFCHLTEETDRLDHSINRIKKAQQHATFKTPRLWAKANGLNHDISVKTAVFIIETAVLYNANTIVFEHLDKNGKVNSSKKQKLKLWRSQEVQSIVENKAHRLGMRISHVNAYNTSRLAYDGSGLVKRSKENYSICTFQTGKIYNCDLSASYNIGARYFVREILKSLPAKDRLCIEAKVPQCSKRSTCTFSTLISLNAELLSA